MTKTKAFLFMRTYMAFVIHIVYNSFIGVLMNILCQICNKNDHIEYIGITNIYGEWKKIFICTGHDTAYFLQSKIDPYKVEMIDKEDREYIENCLANRVPCPKHKEHKKREKYHKYKDVLLISKVTNLDNENHLLRFYCKNHPDKRYNRYQFRYNQKKSIYTLQKLFKSLSEPLYKKLHQIYNQKIIYDIKEDSEDLLYFLFYINLSENVIKDLFLTNQSMIHRLKKKMLKERKIATDIKVNTLSIDSIGRLFYTKVNITKKDFYTLQEEIEDGVFKFYE